MNPSDITIEFLANVPETIPVVARWLFEEFHYLISGKSIDYVTEALNSRLNSDQLPLSIVAIIESEVVGTASLKISDMDVRENLTPWLAGLYVEPKYRNQGIGSLLVEGIEEIARQHGVEKLYLYTPNASAFYQTIGWSRMEEMKYHSHPVIIMEKVL